MVDRLIVGTVAAHRFVFILGTALLAVGTSQLADDACAAASWFLSAGGALLMFVGDRLSDLDRTSAELSRSAGHPISQTRADVFRSRQPLVSWILLGAGLACIAAGLAL